MGTWRDHRPRARSARGWPSPTPCCCRAAATCRRRGTAQRVASDDVYDVDDEQDAFDLAVARWAIDAGVPLLAVCRGWQVVNVALGGNLEQHMAEPHRHVVHDVTVEPGTRARRRGR